MQFQALSYKFIQLCEKYPISMSGIIDRPKEMLYQKHVSLLAYDVQSPDDRWHFSTEAVRDHGVELG